MAKSKLERRDETIQQLKDKLAEFVHTFEFLVTRGCRIQRIDGLIKIAWYDRDLQPQVGSFLNIHEAVRRIEARDAAEVAGPLAEPILRVVK